MNETLSVVCFPCKPSRIKKNGEAPIFARITLNRERVEFTTNHSIPLSMWNAKKIVLKAMEKEL